MNRRKLKVILLAVALCAWPLWTKADGRAPFETKVTASNWPSPSGTETVKLKFGPLTELAAALHELDGQEKVIDMGAGQPPRILRVPYDLKPAVRIALARDIAAVRAALDAFETTRQRTLQDASPGAPERVQTSPELLGKFMVAWNKVTSEPVALELTLVPEDGLNLDTNTGITGTVLAGLAPILKSSGK